GPGGEGEGAALGGWARRGGRGGGGGGGAAGAGCREPAGEGPRHELAPRERGAGLSGAIDGVGREVRFNGKRSNPVGPIFRDPRWGIGFDLSRPSVPPPRHGVNDFPPRAERPGARADPAPGGRP